MVVAELRCPHLRLKAQHLGPVLAERAVHLSFTAHHIHHPFYKGVDYQWVVIEIAGLEKFQIAMVCRHPVGVLVNAAHQHPGKEEIGEHHNSFEAEPHRVAQPWLHQRKGNA